MFLKTACSPLANKDEKWTIYKKDRQFSYDLKSFPWKEKDTKESLMENMEKKENDLDCHPTKKSTPYKLFEKD